jgi:hypothetical protein
VRGEGVGGDRVCEGREGCGKEGCRVRVGVGSSGFILSPD